MQCVDQPVFCGSGVLNSVNPRCEIITVSLWTLTDCDLCILFVMRCNLSHLGLLCRHVNNADSDLADFLFPVADL